MRESGASFLPSVGLVMQRVRFIGRILPTVHVLTIAKYMVSIADNNLATDLTVEIQNNNITVDVDVKQFEPALLGEICRRAIRIARASIDLVSFSTGKGLTLVIELVTLPDGKSGPPSFEFASAPTLSSSYALEQFNKIIPLALEQDVSMALSDLTDTIMQPDRTLINCARAVETIRVLIDPNPDRKLSWQNVHKSLNVTKGYIQLITDHSAGHRHGHYEETRNDTGEEIRIRAWTIMNRFFEFRKINSQPLPITEFPILS